MALIFVTLTIPVLIGFSLLAIDMARVNNLHNDLQKGADAFALAGASELDGRSDSIERATTAIANLVDNQYRFSAAGNDEVLAAAGVVVRFLEGLPASDADVITAGFVADSAEDARFVEVVVSPVGFATIFPATLFGGSNTFNITASSVGGFAGTTVCDMTPLFICNPFEGEGDLHTIADEGNFYGKGLRLVAKGGSGAWGPGNFGFLNPTGENGYGANELAADIASDNLPACITTRGLVLSSGGEQPAMRDAINVRFDIFAGSFTNDKAKYAAASNVRKGFEYKGKGKNQNACNMDPATDTTQFRQLTQDLSYPGLGGRLGSGLWDYEGYLAANNFSEEDMLGFVDADGQAYSNANPPSRYDLYLFELDHPELIARQSIGGETGIPACSATDRPDRRLIYGALINCLEHAAEMNGQSGAPIPAEGYASFFLTEPVDQARTNGDIMAEIVDIDGEQGRGTMIDFARDEVQLYR